MSLSIIKGLLRTFILSVFMGQMSASFSNSGSSNVIIIGERDNVRHRNYNISKYWSLSNKTHFAVHTTDVSNTPRNLHPFFLEKFTFKGQKDDTKNKQNLRKSISIPFLPLVYSKFWFYHLKKMFPFSCSHSWLKADMPGFAWHTYRKFHIESRQTGTDLGLPINFSLWWSHMEICRRRNQGFSCSIHTKVLAASSIRSF